MKAAFTRITIVLLCCMAGLPFSSYGQNITGIWRGEFHTFFGDNYRFEIQIKQTGTTIKGVSYSYLDTRFYGKATLVGNYSPKQNKALIQEIKTVEVKMEVGSAACIMKCSFVYTRSGKEEFLEGTYTSTFEKGELKGQDCGGGVIRLRKVTTSDFYVEPFLRNTTPPRQSPPATTKPATKPPVTKPATQKPPAKTTTPTRKPVAINNTAGKPANKPVNKLQGDTAKNRSVTIPVEKKDPIKINVPAITRSRENELVKTFVVYSEEVEVKFYDNGEIDNDTISVYLNGKPIVSNQRLSTVPITIKLNLAEDQPEHVLVMVAENLGRIPPNTSLMIVQDGDRRYQASITSTNQKNAMVRFRYKKE